STRATRFAVGTQCGASPPVIGSSMPILIANPPPPPLAPALLLLLLQPVTMSTAPATTAPSLVRFMKRLLLCAPDGPTRIQGVHHPPGPLQAFDPSRCQLLRHDGGSSIWTATRSQQSDDGCEFPALPGGSTGSRRSDAVS